MRELLNLYSAGCKYSQAYKMAEEVRVKLELSFSVDARQRLAELEDTISR